MSLYLNLAPSQTVPMRLHKEQRSSTLLKGINHFRVDVHCPMFRLVIPGNNWYNSFLDSPMFVVLKAAFHILKPSVHCKSLHATLLTISQFCLPLSSVPLSSSACLHPHFLLPVLPVAILSIHPPVPYASILISCYQFCLSPSSVSIHQFRMPPFSIPVNNSACRRPHHQFYSPACPYPQFQFCMAPA